MSQTVGDTQYAIHLLQMLFVVAQHADTAGHLGPLLKLLPFCGFILDKLNHRAAIILPDGG